MNKNEKELLTIIGNESWMRSACEASLRRIVDLVNKELDVTNAIAVAEAVLQNCDSIKESMGGILDGESN